MLRTFLSRCALAASLSAATVLAAAPAESKVKVDVYVGDGYGYGYGHHHNYNYGRISCQRGANIIDRSGYGSVVILDCGGRYYTYRARNNGKWYRIVLDSRTGYIVDRQRL